jgi:electron transport complex protein RnfD
MGAGPGCHQPGHFVGDPLGTAAQLCRSKRPITVGNGNAALIGLLIAMLLPASAPWWLVIIGTFLAIVIGMQIFGGIGANPFCPVALAIAILMVSYKTHMDFDAATGQLLTRLPVGNGSAGRPESLRPCGCGAHHPIDLLMGRQVGGLGSSCGLALALGGIYLMLRGIIRWEISIAFIAGVLHQRHAVQHGRSGALRPPVFHLFTGYTLIGAFFLATERSSSPVNFIPMLDLRCTWRGHDGSDPQYRCLCGWRYFRNSADQSDKSAGRQDQTQGNWKGGVTWVK